MAHYFAKLDGDIVGIDAYCRFEAQNMEDAQMIAESYAMDNYTAYEDLPEDDSVPYFAEVEVWDDNKHRVYLGQGCFTDYL